MEHLLGSSFKKFALLSLILVMMLTALTACISTDPLYGKWVEPSSGVQLEIKNNGEILTTLNGTSFTLKYTLEVPDVIVLAASQDGSVPEQRVTYLADKDTLTLTVNGVNTVFQREK